MRNPVPGVTYTVWICTTSVYQVVNAHGRNSGYDRVGSYGQSAQRYPVRLASVCQHPDRCRDVFGLYLERPRGDASVSWLPGGRFRYSDLKEAVPVLRHLCILNVPRLLMR
jgi:hypothetical protein